MGGVCQRLYRSVGVRGRAYKSSSTSLSESQVDSSNSKKVPVLPRVHNDAVMGVCSTDDPWKTVSCSDDQSIVLFDWKKGEIVERWNGHKKPVNKVAFGPKTQCIYSASRDTTLKVWRRGISEAQQTFTGHTLTVSTVTIDSDERRICSGSRDYSVRVWDVESGVTVQQSKVTQNMVTCVKWFPGEDAVLQVGEDLTVRIWDIRTMAVAQSFRGVIYIPLCADIAPDGHLFVISSHGFDSDGCDAKLWDRRKDGIVREFVGHSQSANACAFLPLSQTNGNLMFATGSADQSIRVWDTQSGLCSAIVKPPNSSSILCLAAASSPNCSSTFYSGCFNESVHSWHFRDGDLTCVACTEGARPEQSSS
mmetsp:Transcript_22125/g.37066  ORF Transcript_22125/g.37066 Transcript_22125/m.37066 type:complete len:364 (+) Transcript_22125:51-1142(+)